MKIYFLNKNFNRVTHYYGKLFQWKRPQICVRTTVLYFNSECPPIPICGYRPANPTYWLHGKSILRVCVYLRNEFEVSDINRNVKYIGLRAK